MPVAVKDLFCTAGVPSQAGSRILEGYRPPYTATSIARLAGAGAPLLGKTNQDEFAMGSSTENSAYGPTLNPWDPSRACPAARRAAAPPPSPPGSAPWSIGTDTGGSIRQPAALCGIVGLKPTYGAVSRYGMIAFASSLDQAGTFTRDVTDAALLFGAMAGKDPCDSTSVGLPGPVAAPDAHRPARACASACRRSCRARASSRACSPRSRPRWTSPASSARRSRRCGCRTRRTRSAPTT